MNEEVEIFETKRKDTSKFDKKLKAYRFVFNKSIEIWVDDELVYKTRGNE